MTDKHTPGPWQIGPNFDDTFILVVSSDGFVARTVAGNDEANARLIAASPDLLAACKLAAEAAQDIARGPCLMEAYIEQMQDEVLPVLLAAIEKAQEVE